MPSPKRPVPVTPDRPARRWLRGLALLATALALLGIFWAYRSPHLAVDLAIRVWGCF